MKYRQDTFSRERARYFSPNYLKRPTGKQIEAAAKRFERDGEHENAANMRALIKETI